MQNGPPSWLTVHYPPVDQLSSTHGILQEGMPNLSRISPQLDPLKDHHHNTRKWWQQLKQHFNKLKWPLEMMMQPMSPSQPKPLPMMDWSIEDIHKEFPVFKTLGKVWLETKDVPDHKQYMFIPQLLGKEDMCCWESLALTTPNNNYKEQSDHIWGAFEGSFRQTTSFRSCRSTS